MGKFIFGAVYFGLMLSCCPIMLAQSSFTVTVRDSMTQAPVVSRIEYEATPGNWRTLKQTDTQGILNGNCPGSVSIRANASPAFRLSSDELCGGNHTLMVSRRTVREILAFLPKDTPLTTSEWVVGYTAAALAEGRSTETSSSEEQAILMLYVSDPTRLASPLVRGVNVNLRAGPIVEFRRIDADDDQVVSQAELRTALRGD
jgi:hypothetical protein